jgi:hypothetical protein
VKADFARIYSIRIETPVGSVGSFLTDPAARMDRP